MTENGVTQHWVATSYGSLDGLEKQGADVPPPGPGEVTVDVVAVGMNPADAKAVLLGSDASKLPLAIGYEVAGRVAAVGDDVGLAPGDEVVAFRVSGGYTTSITVPSTDVFPKPPALGWPEAANLLLAGTTAAEMLHVAGVESGQTILVHGASGAVGVSVIQQARLLGATVIGTASERTFGVVEGFGATGVVYGDGLEERVRSLTPHGIDAALDCVGTDEAVDVSLALVADRGRIVSIAAFGRAERDGYRVVGGAMPESAAFRDSVRAHLLELAGAGQLVVPIATTFAFDDAKAALELVGSGHAGGKVALLV
ncbi:NADPH:quinone reductase-like Zn-dependent oxidoreductase [Frondihabitans sp. PhB188]|uniref:NADP-dependent oxidoreductase n=1 Tax=Frondihabitans sp. PhB188 TaxID=2485200 RepID=UPI000F48F5B9|nr:NADP-dependent oxidoreductase [Frondihabitans sp. PhB188]ROQ37293.1 NADPH:quinone reductase-like Zn-dependent oxidoreductase [Frondihabitans sp. PhB188]